MYNGISAFLSMAWPMQVIVGFLIYTIANTFSCGLLGSILNKLIILIKRLVNCLFNIIIAIISLVINKLEK